MSEGTGDHIFRIFAIQLLPKHGQDHGEADGLRGLPHHDLQVLLCGVLPQQGQHVMQVLLVNEAVSVLVHHVEGLLKLLDLGLLKHCKDIECGPLWPLFGSLDLSLLTNILASGGWSFSGVEKALSLCVDLVCSWMQNPVQCPVGAGLSLIFFIRIVEKAGIEILQSFPKTLK